MRLREPGEPPRDTLSRALGAALRAARGALPRTALAARTGVDVKTLQDLEQGRANPTLDTVERIAEAYGLELRLTYGLRRPGP